MSKVGCLCCLYFKPHIYVSSVGYCSLKGRCAFGDGVVCSGYREKVIDDLKKALSDVGWVYCVTCRRTLVDESELEDHFNSHVVVADVLIDEAVSDEAPSAD